MLDITFDGISPQRVYDRLLEWRKAGKFTDGLGIYPSSGFVHIDTRGRNAIWKGKQLMARGLFITGFTISELPRAFTADPR